MYKEAVLWQIVYYQRVNIPTVCYHFELLFDSKEVHIDKQQNETSFEANWPYSKSYKEEYQGNMIKVNSVHTREEYHNEA